MTQREFDTALAESKARAEAIASVLPSAPETETEALLRAYIGCRYLLRPEEMRTDRLLALGEQSTAKLAGLQQSGVKFTEKSAGCTTASSGVIKKMLLAIALGKLIGVRLDPDQVAETETIPELAALINHTKAKGGT